jgi:hypothetical protein
LDEERVGLWEEEGEGEETKETRLGMGIYS